MGLTEVQESLGWSVLGPTFCARQHRGEVRLEPGKAIIVCMSVQLCVRKCIHV